MRLRGYGDGIVAEQAAMFIRSYMEVRDGLEKIRQIGAHMRSNISAGRKSRRVERRGFMSGNAATESISANRKLCASLRSEPSASWGQFGRDAESEGWNSI